MIFNQELVRIKQKFLVTSIACFVLLTIFSGFYLYLNHQLVAEQKLFLEFDSKVKKQLLLITDISTLSQLYTTENGSDLDQVKSNFKGLYRDLLKRNEEFTKWLVRDDVSNLRFIDNILKDKTVRKKMLDYMSVAKQFIGRNENTIEEIKENIDYLTKSSATGLGDLLEEITYAVELKQAASLKKLEQISIGLVFFSVLQFFLLWLFIYRPLFQTVLNQNERITSSLIEIESASKSKMNFLANISHEIRTPMFIILGYIDRLRSKNLTSQQKEEAMNLVTQNANHLLSIIDEILDISKVEAGKIEFKIANVDLENLLSEVYGLLKIKAEEKGLRLIFTDSNEIPKMVQTDPKRLKQILYNLVGNSIKFTAEGHVELRVKYNKDSSKLAFYVSDTGVGISSKNLKKIFKPFEQADESVSRKFGGTGLGLAISRSLARGLGGDLSVLKSSIGVGTTMKLAVFAQESDVRDNAQVLDSSSVEGELLKEVSEVETTSSDTSDAEPDAKSGVERNDLGKLSGKSILVVDDAVENARLFYLYLNEAGADVDLAYSGDEAIGKFKDNSYDLVLLDLQMPKVDGYQAIKEMKKINSTLPIIALTAHALDEERVKTKAAGFADHITKPISAEDLIEAILSNT